MERISKEDGINAGARNIGRYLLAMIPWALAVGVGVAGEWITFHEWQREARQAQRAAVYVAAPEPQVTAALYSSSNLESVTLSWVAPANVASLESFIDAIVGKRLTYRRLTSGVAA